MSRKGKRQRQETRALLPVTGLDQRGRGRVPVGESRVPAFGALPGELAEVSYRTGGRVRAVRVERVVLPSPARVLPRCPYFGLCGGCSLQHLDGTAQLAFKQQRLLDQLAAAAVLPERVLAPLAGPRWHYRRRARLGARYVIVKQRLLVGFRERGGSYITDMANCHVLVTPLARLVAPLAGLIGSLSLRDRVPQVEAAAGDDRVQLVLRLLDEPTDDDRVRLLAFADRHRVELCLQRAGPDSVLTLAGAAPRPLHYRLPEFDLELAFTATDFVQVNGPLNRALATAAVDLLEPAADERLLDLFCGLGNFTLPLARRGGAVVGVEQGEGMVARARANAAANGIGNATFLAHDLYQTGQGLPSGLEGRFDKLLIDPPRSGAGPVLGRLAEWSPRRIVYVSCNPETLAHDAGLLRRELGYRLVAAGVVDMFPHTDHAEALALFEPLAG